MSTTKSNPKVLIVGAGLGGLALAQCLRKAGISFSIFERDRDDHSRRQGYAINLSEALPGMTELFPSDLPDMEARTSVMYPLGGASTQGRTYDWDNGEMLCDMPQSGKGEQNYTLRVNRSWLRSWLSTDIDVEWDKQFVRYEETPSGVKLFFKDGSTATGDILVGADGSNSHVRSQLIPTSPPNKAASVGCISGIAVLDKDTTAHNLALSRGGALIVKNEMFYFQSARHLASDLSSGDFFWSVMWDDDTAAAQGDDFWTLHASKEDLKAHATKLVADMHPKLRTVFDATKVDDFDRLKLAEWMPPDALPESKITLLGDAAHVTTPFRGAGANCAFLDAFDLARTLIKAHESEVPLESVLRSYESVLLPRGRKVVQTSHDTAFTEDRKQWWRDMQERLNQGQKWGSWNEKPAAEKA